MATEIRENIWRVDIPLPNNPLRGLNCYIIKGGFGERNLIIDTGFNISECKESLLNGIAEVGISPAESDVFLTHCHSDHTGNAHMLHELGCNIYIGRLDYNTAQPGDFLAARHDWLLSEGMPEDTFREVAAANPAVKFKSAGFPAALVDNGQIFNCGGYSLKCILTPGHSKGHMCLYDARKKLLFSGDHVLFDITPNICSWGNGTNALGSYLKSLDLISALDIAETLPAHRGTDEISVYERIEQLKAHHKTRLGELVSLVENHPLISGYELAGMLTWKIKADSWDTFPPGQKWFALGEALAHLDYLVAEGIVKRTYVDELVKYTL